MIPPMTHQGKPLPIGRALYEHTSRAMNYGEPYVHLDEWR
jgi:hypothetical protein